MFKLTRWFLTHFFVLAIVASSAHAQSTRTWVSGVGDDANPCSRTAPCKTFAGAISKTAASGEINVLDPGGFGSVTINKAITIDGSGGSIAGISAPGTAGVLVNAGTGDAVVLRNLDINGAGTGTNGIVFNSGKSLRIENTKIYGFNEGIMFDPSGTSTLLIEKTDVYANSDIGLLVLPYSGVSVRVTVIDSTFSNNLYGIFASGAGAVVYISGITVTHNNVGIYTSSGAGVWAQGNNRIMNNTSDGSPTGYLPQYSGTLIIY